MTRPSTRSRHCQGAQLRSPLRLGTVQAGHSEGLANDGCMNSRGIRSLSAGVVVALVLASVAVSGAPLETHKGQAHSHTLPASVPFLQTAKAIDLGPPGSEVVVDRKGLRLTAHHTGQASWEPTIGTTESGDLYATAWKSFVQPDVFRSTDRGESWTEVSPGNGNGVSMDPYLFTDENRVFNLDAYALTCGVMSFSDDGGTSWLTNPVACGTVVSDHPSAFAGPPVSSTPVGYPKVIYVCDYRPFGLRSTVYCSKSVTGGLTFTPTGDPVFPVVGNDPCTALTGHGVAGRNGAIYIPRVTPCGPELAVSTDEGSTWRVIALPNGPGTSGDHEASVAVDGRGNVFYMWIGADRLPYLTVSTDGTKSFSRPRMIAPHSVTEANMPALSVNAKGHLVMAYVGSTNAPPIMDESPQPCGNASTECPASPAYRDVTWNGYVSVSRAPTSPSSRFQTHTINPANDPIDDEACGPGRCFPIGDFIDVTSGPDGTFWAAFLDGCSMTTCVDAYGAELLIVEIETD